MNPHSEKRGKACTISSKRKALAEVSMNPHSEKRGKPRIIGAYVRMSSTEVSMNPHSEKRGKHTVGVLSGLFEFRFQ